MITSILVYSLFITNPAGTLGPHIESTKAPYFFYEESQQREYKTYEECDTVAKEVKAELAQKADALFRAANTPAKDIYFRAQQAKYQSLKCKSVERQIDTAYANTVDGSKPFVVEQPKPKPAPVQAEVVQQQMAVPASTPAPAAVASQPMRQPQQYPPIPKAISQEVANVSGGYGSSVSAIHPPVAEPVQITPPSVVQMPVLLSPQLQPPQRMNQVPAQEVTPPAKQYYVTEMNIQPDGQYVRQYYTGSYFTVVACLQALDSFVRIEQDNATTQYRANPTPGNWSWLNARLYDLSVKRQRMSCVS